MADAAVGSGWISEPFCGSSNPSSSSNTLISDAAATMLKNITIQH